MHRNTPATLNHNYLQNRNGGDPCLPSLHSWGSATTDGSGMPHTTPGRGRRPGRQELHTGALCSPWKSFLPTPWLDFVLLFSRNKQRASRAANRGSECEGSALQTRMGTCTLLPMTSWPLPELCCIQLGQRETGIRETRAQPGPPGWRHQLRWHLGGTFCLLTGRTICLWCLHIRHMPPHPPTHRLTQAPSTPRWWNSTSRPSPSPKGSSSGWGCAPGGKGCPLPHSSSSGVWRRGWRNFPPAHHLPAAWFPKATRLMQ